MCARRLFASWIACAYVSLCCAGIIAINDSVVHSALLKADELHPHFVAFIDNGSWTVGRTAVTDLPVPDHVPPVCALTKGDRDLLLLVYGNAISLESAVGWSSEDRSNALADMMMGEGQNGKL